MTTDLAETILIGIACAVVASAFFATGVLLQHRVVSAMTPAGELGRSALRKMVRSPGWLAGVGSGVLGGCLHVVALSFAPVAIVEPVGVLGLVSIVVVGARLRREHVDVGTRRAVLAVCAGVGGFVVVAAGAISSQPVAQTGQVQFVVACAAVVGFVGWQQRSCLATSAAAAVVSGFGSTVVRAASQHWQEGGAVAVDLGLSVEAAALLLTGGWLMQRAYARGTAALVVGTTTVLGPITSVLVGLTLYGEATGLTGEDIAGMTLLALLAIAGVRVLAQSMHPTEPVVAVVPPVEQHAHAA
ncbi:hypothetical protein [Actinokineospora inagensis]|uniref:hypothetical protein n=1 Tax=Actinokineospora inagensis TaxID=103730 RepID=UPI000416A0A6|nr:hypothetical protein [Actinokineospora inagensis]